MTPAAAVVLLVLLGVVALSVTTLVIAVRGGRGPADPPASHLRVDPAGFPVLPEPRGVLHSRRRVRAAAARTAAASHTARDSRTAGGTSAAPGGRPVPSGGRSSIRFS